MILYNNYNNNNNNHNHYHYNYNYTSDIYSTFQSSQIHFTCRMKQNKQTASHRVKLNKYIFNKKLVVGIVSKEF